jgi:flagellin-like hook-associated protein FlgL
MTIGGTTYTLTQDAVDSANTFVTGATAAVICGKLEALAAADATATVTDNSDGTLTLTAKTAGNALNASTASTDGGATSVLANSTPNVDTSINVDLTRLNIFETGTAETGLITSGSLDLLDSTTNASLSNFSVADFVTFIQNAASSRADNGAVMSRLEASHAMLTTNHANIEAARSRLMDVDIAIESTHFAKHNILVQSSAAMLSQANGIPNIALQLLG